MVLKVKIIIRVIVFCISAKSINAQVVDTLQPYAPYWFISDLLEWTPEKDCDAVFNRSFTPLAVKTYNPEFKMNPHARANEAKIEILPIFASTSGNPSQGSLDSSYYAFTYWQYVDLMVYWGGSSFEGIILTPNAGVIDAAHRNGVPIYGTVFFPPLVYGGKRDWVYEFVQKKDGKFPVADKLIEVAQYFGFDGWFINQESGNSGEVSADEELARSMQEFMLYYKSNSNLSIQWYDAMMNDGTVQWQHELNSTNEMFFQDGEKLIADQMFLDFRFTKENLAATKINAKRLGRNLYDIYGGVDVQNNGYNAEPGYTYPQGANFDVLFPEDKPHAISMGLYVPSWTYLSSISIQDFHKRESRFWVGEKGDPRNTKTTHNWKGVAHYVPAKTAITQLPFATNFCVGQGKRFFYEGMDITSPTWDKGWNNLALQDIQPTWRWVMDGARDKLNVKFDFQDGYIGGNCLKVSGELSGECILRLYSTKLELTKNTKCKIIYKTETNKNTELFLLLVFKDGKELEIPVKRGRGKGWQIFTHDLKRYSDKEICQVSLKFKSEKSDHIDFKFGQLAIVNNEEGRVLPVSNVRVLANATSGDDLNNVRVSWDKSESDCFCYFVYKINHDGKRIFLGATTSNACFLPLVPCDEETRKCIIGVEAIGRDFRKSSLRTIHID